ncbi:MAG: CDP-diacylglycerol--glycerol-3-phosphate 3-phosphatidyltransferase [Clostridia bacterium]|nr:CDP-diacylglycerol--glycerol-3-phosphate 3-phosphatidyltransferase [Clostridia bacterium]
MRLNVPNRLTVARILITPVFLTAFLWKTLPYRFLIACIIFVAGSITDAVDGHLARKNNEVTNFGKLLDPVADKILTTAALIGFMSEGLCSPWVLFVILVREFTITSIRSIAAADGVVIPANYWGKVKTVCQMVFTIIIMLLCQFEGFLSFLPFSVNAISSCLMWICAVLTVVSGAVYIKDSVKVIDFSK